MLLVSGLNFISSQFVVGGARSISVTPHRPVLARVAKSDLSPREVGIINAGMHLENIGLELLM